MRDYSIHLERKSSRRTNLLPIIIGVVLFLILTSIVLYFAQRKDIQKDIKNLIFNQSIQKTPLLPLQSNISSQKELLEKIDKISKTTGGTYSVYIYDINKKQGFGINEEMMITAASVNKTAILAALYFLAGKGEIDLEKIVILQQEDIQDYGTGTIRYDPTGTPYSLKTLARLMMEKSDNTAAFLLGNVTIGIDKVQQLVDSWRLTQTNIMDNKTSAKDMSLLLTKMYLGQITTKPLTSEMLGFMDKSDFDDRIPKGVPEGIKVYHKTGDEIGKIHDVGIVELPNRPYFLGILTTDTTDSEATRKTGAQMSEWVFNYMQKL